ncbi:hypothetical protein AX774_g6277 [Zancudomyces culisetae]|uniref:Uncharacterized protein n=1 Tax=Zancudomyces culisetae TaxID=1213189 RepID=A0A1R1PH38_ZANCU|nr:hypothetical protein AX774_g6277 [Zancudomyces culisetae]|eukprot:OMH80291.1 hypothetical protein AX774_g6277 [Zancudomyces culisetae]
MLVPILLLLSLVMNVYYITRPRPLKLPELLEKMYEKEQNAGEGGSQLDSNIRTIDYSEYTDLIVVPGHSIYNGKGSPLKKNNWILKEWQKNDVGVYLKHIARSIEILKEHDSSLLLFSG